MNFKVKTYNAIAETGLSLLKDSDFEISENLEAPDAMILRSYKLTNNDIESSIKAIAFFDFINLKNISNFKISCKVNL